MLQIQIIECETPVEIERCKKIRIEVFCDEQGFSADEEFDKFDQDPTTKYFLAVDANTSDDYGTVRLVNDNKLTRLAVRAKGRGNGIAKKLCFTLEDYVRKSNPDCLSLKTHSQLQRKSFYAQLGYRVDENKGVFDEDGMDHVLMWKQL
ncbi:hypothetical protein NEOLI_002983 [Neolecta irregularis DAH-3]|uniref:N-acetyltransferase domain-containing protein n=1 Tax=Neolecta irregularis (strain DAH-3) TaxID=1198029 RepID=A0A1U7LR61_NEOID|nr:hypothetical protein NEOLI_002983 [Neolecta irregularis DAH-3]|eukprot:OLL25160.1 hypothetical protein NEOLI_002983 [Neolecta irregularis DAH-3]